MVIVVLVARPKAQMTLETPVQRCVFLFEMAQVPLSDNVIGVSVGNKIRFFVILTKVLLPYHWDEHNALTPIPSNTRVVFSQLRAVPFAPFRTALRVACRYELDISLSSVPIGRAYKLDLRSTCSAQPPTVQGHPDSE